VGGDVADERGGDTGAEAIDAEGCEVLSERETFPVLMLLMPTALGAVGGKIWEDVDDVGDCSEAILFPAAGGGVE